MTERERERQVRHRLAVLRHVEEVSGNVAATCRYYGISRNCFCKWLRRYEAEGADGLKDRSSKPHYSPRASTPRLNGKVERSHRIDSEEFYQLLGGQVLDDTRLFAHKLQEWKDHYNYHRPHGALGGQA